MVEAVEGRRRPQGEPVALDREAARLHLPARRAAARVRGDGGHASGLRAGRPGGAARAHGRRARPAARRASRRTAERGFDLQEPARRSRRAADRGGGAEGRRVGRRAHLGAARELHRERRRRAGRRRAGADGVPPSGRCGSGVGYGWSPRSGSSAAGRPAPFVARNRRRGATWTAAARRRGGRVAASLVLAAVRAVAGWPALRGASATIRTSRSARS